MKPFIWFLSDLFSTAHWVSFPKYLSVYFLNFKNLLETETLLGMPLLPFQSTQVHWKVSDYLMTGMLGWQLWNWFSTLDLASGQQYCVPPCLHGFYLWISILPFLRTSFCLPSNPITLESFSSSGEGFVFIFPVVHANNLSDILGFSILFI